MLKLVVQKFYCMEIVYCTVCKCRFFFPILRDFNSEILSLDWDSAFPQAPKIIRLGTAIQLK